MILAIIQDPWCFIRVAFTSRAPALEVAVRRVRGFDPESLQGTERHTENSEKTCFLNVIPT